MHILSGTLYQLKDVFRHPPPEMADVPQIRLHIPGGFENSGPQCQQIRLAFIWKTYLQE
jgi:hypothetical protein